MHRLLEREQQRLGGVALRWERVFAGPRRGALQETLVREQGELTRTEAGSLDARAFELPPTLSPAGRSGGGWGALTTLLAGCFIFPRRLSRACRGPSPRGHTMRTGTRVAATPAV